MLYNIETVNIFDKTEIIMRNGINRTGYFFFQTLAFSFQCANIVKSWYYSVFSFSKSTKLYKEPGCGEFIYLKNCKLLLTLPCLCGLKI